MTPSDSVCCSGGRRGRYLPLTLCVVQEEWGHVEHIELLNDGSGLGFGIVGGKATGVVVRTLVPNSVADKVWMSTQTHTHTNTHTLAHTCCGCTLGFSSIDRQRFV